MGKLVHFVISNKNLPSMTQKFERAAYKIAPNSHSLDWNTEILYYPTHKQKITNFHFHNKWTLRSEFCIILLHGWHKEFCYRLLIQIFREKLKKAATLLQTVIFKNIFLYFHKFVYKGLKSESETIIDRYHLFINVF